MLLSDLIESHDKCVLELMDAIQKDFDHTRVEAIDSRIKLFASSIRDMHLSSPADINRQIKFFLNRTHAVSEDSLTAEDRKTVELLIDRYTSQPNLELGMASNNSIIGTKAIVNLGTNRFVSDELIAQSKARISLYNLSYEYEYTSLGNARFHNDSPESFVGKHVSQIVGDRRFERRARRYYDQCFGGEHVRYSYFLEVGDLGERLMNCQMTPYRDSDGSVRGALFAIEDITDLLEQATQSAISNAVN